MYINQEYYLSKNILSYQCGEENNNYCAGDNCCMNGVPCYSWISELHLQKRKLYCPTNLNKFWHQAKGSSSSNSIMPPSLSINILITLLHMTGLIVYKWTNYISSISLCFKSIGSLSLLISKKNIKNLHYQFELLKQYISWKY